MADTTFGRIRDHVVNDLKPVTPLATPSIGALVTIPVGIFLLSVVLIVYGIRADASQLGLWPIWGPASAMVMAAYALLALALRERVPGAGASLAWWVTLPVIAIGVQIGGALYTFRSSGASVKEVATGAQAMCLWHITLLAVPPVVIALWLLSRGLTVRPRLAGLMGGFAGGVVSEGIYRLHCGLAQPSHIVTWHTGAILVMAFAGLLGGMLWERRQLVAWARPGGE